MKRVLWAVLLVMAGVTTVLAESETLDVPGVGGAEVHFHEVEYTRELWAAVRPEGVEASELLDALRRACDDTTAVAVIEAGSQDFGTPEEREVIAAVSVKAALADLKKSLGIESDYTRVVLVGVLESCVTAARVANDPGHADGLVLIDPPVGDLVRLEVNPHARVGLDVLLHPRSDAEFEREQRQIIDGLGAWGRSARVLKADRRFGSVSESLVQVWSTVRGYTVMLEGQSSQLSARELAGMLDEYDVVFVGELHGNPAAHRVELEFLRHFLAGDRPFALATEQWERDTQSQLDAFLAGRLEESEFVTQTRAWPNYADYRPLIHLCRQANVPVIAGNIPRPLASRVFKEGVEVIEEFTEEEKSWTAGELNAMPGAYKRKFMDTMGGRNDRTERMYAAQCIKDDTMAESVAKWLKANPGGRVLHINGSFHSAGGLGAAEKMMMMRPELEIAMVTCVQTGGDFEAGPDEWIIRVPSTRPRRTSNTINPHE